MLDTSGKLLEKILVQRLRSSFGDAGISSNQYGFRPGRSTIDAMSRVRQLVVDANGRGQARNLYVGMVTVDVKNAFNSAPWHHILAALREKNVPEYLQSIIGAYLAERRLNVTLPDGGTRSSEIWRGVPQGSVLGPDLWNVLYDGLLAIPLPRDVETIAFADDIALIATAQVASIPPLELLAKERTDIYGGLDRTLARDGLLRRWQEDMETATTGRWTFRLIGDLRAWHERRHGEVNFRLSQALTGHGCFRSYLHRFGKSETDECAICGVSPDDAEHAIFNCDLAHRWRTDACGYLGIHELTPDNIVGVMLSSADAWSRVSGLISRIMRVREEEERARQHAAAGNP